MNHRLNFNICRCCCNGLKVDVYGSGDFGKSNYCDKWFMLLSVAIRGGLFHPNCRHTMGQYIEGLTKIPQPIPAEKIREQRALEEKQRAMERKIRALKRKVEGTQDEKKVKEYKRKLREEQGKLREFIKEHDDVLRRDYSREKIYSGKGEPKQEAPRTEEAPVKATDTESKNPVPTDKEPYVSKPDNNENTINFVQSEPVKTVQSNEDTDDTPTAVVSDEAVETAKTTESIQETVKQPIETATDSEEDVQNFTDDTVDNSDESVNENVELPASDIHIIGKLDVETYSCVTEDIITDDVIITDKQIEHIKERHPDDFERFSQYFEEIIKHPDYIIEANKPNTALILKEIKINNERFKTILRLVTSQDNPAYKNSIITFMKINEKDWKRILKNKKILYKSE